MAECSDKSLTAQEQNTTEIHRLKFHEGNGGVSTIDALDGDMLLSILRQMEERGISFVVGGVRWMGPRSLTAEGAIKYASIGHLRFYAELFGLTEDEMDEWLTCNGSIQCFGKTAKGSRCKNMAVPDQAYLDPVEWIKLVTRKVVCFSHSDGGPKIKAGYAHTWVRPEEIGGAK